MQKIVGFEDYRVALPSASQHVVDVVEETGNTVVAQGISLEELYDKHVKPGHMLYLTQKVDKGMAENVKKMRKEQVAQWTNKFAIAQPYSGRVKNTGKQLGGLKYIMITLANPVTHVRLVLDRAYQFIANGSPVEFQIRLKGSYTKKARKKQEKERLKGKEVDGETDGKTDGGPGVVQEEDEDEWVWLHNHFPHLRPDFILKSMPEGSRYLIYPVKDEVKMKFVVSLEATVMPAMNLNKRVKLVKAAVLEGRQLKGKKSRPWHKNRGAEEWEEGGEMGGDGGDGGDEGRLGEYRGEL